jgi:hypothetical protein
MPEQLTYNSPDGATMGSSATELISFYGATPVAQYTAVPAASTYLVSTSVISGFATANNVTSLVRQLSTVVVALKALGLVA